MAAARAAAGKDTGAEQALHLNTAALIISNGSDVLGAEAEARAGHHRAGHLATGAEDLLMEGHFAGVGRKVGYDEERVGGVEPDTNDIEFRH